ncbi:AraC family transcriptional regulator [Microvirga sp. BT350]|uniref:AraC family transcriptional regulator n=2 Tax=Microvirga alba TaxID=2791025 RepID=A0A931FLJ2_9HYPH|nr:AraC family transcriptional regulator [Microvirga alba]
MKDSAVLHPKANEHLAVDHPRRIPVKAGFIHLGVIKELIPVLQDFGTDPESVIREAGLDPRLFEEASNVIAFSSLNKLLTLAATRTRCPHLGLLVGRKATISSMGIVGCLMQHSKTVGGALESLVRHLHLQNRVAVPKLVVSGGEAMLSLRVYAPVGESADQIADASLATAFQSLAAICGPRWVAAEVLLPRKQPADPQPYRDFFRAPLRFNEEAATLVFSASWLASPIAGADAVFRQIFEERIAELEAVPNRDFRDEVRRALRSRLLKNKCSAGEVASYFAIHRRTLHRRLVAEGTDFSAIVDEMRFEIARQLLAATNITLGQVAAALSYSEAGAFTRAFRRWSGQTPKSWRAEHRRR